MSLQRRFITWRTRWRIYCCVLWPWCDVNNKKISLEPDRCAQCCVTAAATLRQARKSLGRQTTTTKPGQCVNTACLHKSGALMRRRGGFIFLSLLNYRGQHLPADPSPKTHSHTQKESKKHPSSCAAECEDTHNKSDWWLPSFLIFWTTLMFFFCWFGSLVGTQVVLIVHYRTRKLFYLCYNPLSRAPLSHSISLSKCAVGSWVRMALTKNNTQIPNSSKKTNKQKSPSCHATGWRSVIVSLLPPGPAPPRSAPALPPRTYQTALVPHQLWGANT